MPTPTSAYQGPPASFLRTVRAVIGIGLAFSSLHPLAAQTPRQKAKAQAKAQAKAAQAIDQKQLRQNPPAALERFLQMTPKQRRDALSASGLPPAKQRDLLRRIRALELLSDEERQQLRGRYQQFSELRPPRQQAVSKELRTLRQLPPKDRAERLNSDEAKQKFSGEELQLLKDVAGR